MSNTTNTNTNTIIKEKLIQIKELIKDPAHWTQGAMARNVDGVRTPSCDEDAVCFCLTGAVAKIVYFDSSISEMSTDEIYRGIMHYIGSTITNTPTSVVTNMPLDQCFVINYNDEHTHAEVIALLDKAIASCE